MYHNFLGKYIYFNLRRNWYRKLILHSERLERGMITERMDLMDYVSSIFNIWYVLFLSQFYIKGTRP